jgi:hypothetical protein
MNAKDIVEHPEVADKIRGHYQLIWAEMDPPKLIREPRPIGLQFDNLHQALNIMATKGWKPVAMTELTLGKIFVILERS